jgi:hypothetical protein
VKGLDSTASNSGVNLVTRALSLLPLDALLYFCYDSSFAELSITSRNVPAGKGAMGITVASPYTLGPERTSPLQDTGAYKVRGEHPPPKTLVPVSVFDSLSTGPSILKCVWGIPGLLEVRLARLSSVNPCVVYQNWIHGDDVSEPTSGCR